MSELQIEIVYAGADRQSLLELNVPPGTRVGEAVRISEIASTHPEENFDRCAVGIWGRVVDRQQTLKTGDRVELYRPLQMDPREARRQLALIGRTMAGADQN
ncbi:MAG TPA: RnfH family protein [Woeseiaceae bacterium]|nr:RnfH family protein [Woeseiaceae bacterium]